MDLGLKGRRALVAGASKGLGYASAAALAAEGASVFVASRDASAIAAAADRIGAAGHLAADVSRAEDVESLLAAAEARLGGIDILVCNSGGPPPGSFLDTDLAAWQGAFDLLLMSTARMMKGVLPGMRSRGWGRIVCITSISVRQPIPILVLSNSVRAAVTGLAKSVALEVAADGVTVNCVAPGSIMTERLTSIRSQQAERAGISLEEALRTEAQAIPAGRIGTPEEFGAVCTFLCSEQAAYVTGQTLGVDGGLLRGVH